MSDHLPLLSGPVRAYREPRRRVRFGRILVLLVLVALIGGGAWMALMGPLSPARLRADLERSVERATGRKFMIAGPIHVSLSLVPLISAEGISLANIEGGSRPEMITAAALQARLALLPLLAGDLVLDRVVLKQPDILLETGPDGTPNWQMRPQRRALYGGGGGGGGGSSSVEIRAVDVEGGVITYRPVSGPALSANIDHLDLRTDNMFAPVTGTMSGQARGVPFTATLQCGSFARLQGGPVTVMAGAWPLTIAFQSGQASLKIDGGINHPDELRGYGLLVTGNAPDLTPFYPWLPRPLRLPLHDVNFTTRLSDGVNGEQRTSGFSLHAGAADLSAAVPGLTLKEAVVSAPGPGQQMQASVDGLFQGAPLRVVATATQPDVIGANVPISLAMTGQAGTANFSARGTVPSSWNGLGFDLQVNARVPSLSDLSPLARRPLPDVKDLVIDGHVGDAGFRLRGLDLHDLTIASSIGDLSGNVTVAWAPVATLTGSLHSKHADLDAIASAVTLLDTPPPGSQAATAAPVAVTAPPAAGSPPEAVIAADAGPPPPRLIPDTKIDFSMLHDADADLSLTADQLNAGGDVYRDLDAHLSASGGKVVLNPFRVTAPGGVMIGALSLDASADPVPMALSLRGPSMSAGKLVSLLGYPGGATGQVQIDAQLSGTGDTPHDIAASLSGHAGLTMVNGSVTAMLFQNVIGDALSAAGVPPIQGSSDVRCLALRANFSHGQGDFDALAADTSRMSLTGTGTIDLGRETVALHLRPDLRLGGVGVAAPVSVTGGFLDMKAALDPVMSDRFGGRRFGLSIGGPAPNDSACIAALSVARGGMPGPLPAPVAAQAQGPKKKPIDLLRGLFH